MDLKNISQPATSLSSSPNTTESLEGPLVRASEVTQKSNSSLTRRSFTQGNQSTSFQRIDFFITTFIDASGQVKLAWESIGAFKEYVFGFILGDYLLEAFLEPESPQDESRYGDGQVQNMLVELQQDRCVLSQLEWIIKDESNVVRVNAYIQRLVCLERIPVP